MSEYKYDVFFGEKDGWEAHVQITSETPEDLATDRGIILGLLKDIEAKPRFNRGAGTSAQGGSSTGTSTATTAGEPMLAAARAVFPSAQVEAKCPNDGAVMRYKAAGISARTNKAYRAFYACDVCQHKQNASG